jgi:hypothetical protein
MAIACLSILPSYLGETFTGLHLEPYEALLLDLSLPIAREEMRLPERQKAL